MGIWEVIEHILNTKITIVVASGAGSFVSLAQHVNSDWHKTQNGWARLIYCFISGLLVAIYATMGIANYYKFTLDIAVCIAFIAGFFGLGVSNHIAKTIQSRLFCRFIYRIIIIFLKNFGRIK